MSEALPVPLALHEAAIERLHARDPRTREPVPDDALAAAAAALRTARLAAEQIAATADALRRDPTRTGPAVVVELRRIAPQLSDRAGAALDGAAATLARAATDLEASMAPRPPARPRRWRSPARPGRC